MTAKLCDLLKSFKTLSPCYTDFLVEFDSTCAYLNDMLISMSSEAERSKSLYYEAKNKL